MWNPGRGMTRKATRLGRRRLGLAALAFALTACVRRSPPTSPTTALRPTPGATLPPEATPTPAQVKQTIPTPAAPTNVPTVAPTTAPTVVPVTATPGPRPGAIATATPIAVPTGSTIESTSPYGVSFGATELDERSIPALDWAGRAGIRWLRIVFFWNRIAPAPGKLDWSGYDALIAKARSLNISISGQLSFAADWNTSAPITVFRPAQREHYPPADYGAWQTFCKAAVQRYKNQIQCWEVWNEPDLQGFWGGTAAQYARLLAVTYTVVKGISPTATVAMGGLSLGGSPGSLDRNFFAEILDDKQYPARKYFDVANFHAYGTAEEIRQRLDYMRTQLARVGASNVPIWITEIGYPSDAQQQKTPGLQDGPPSQAKWLVEAFTQLRQAGIERLFWFQLYDGNPLPAALADPFGTDGLLDSSLQPKPALQAYHDLIASGR